MSEEYIRLLSCIMSLALCASILWNHITQRRQLKDMEKREAENRALAREIAKDQWERERWNHE